MRILFVVGASRSGTTMLNQILGKHPRIEALNELHYFGELWDVSGPLAEMSDAALETLAARLLARVEGGIWGPDPGPELSSRAHKIVSTLKQDERNGARLFEVVLASARSQAVDMVCDQTPRNIFYAHRLLELYSEAHVINIVRDPRAVLASQKNRWRRKWLGGANIPRAEVLRVWLSYHPLTMGQVWRRAVTAGLALSGHPRVHTVRFEDLAADPAQTVGGLCEHLGVPYHPDMLEVPRVGSSNRDNRDGETGITADVNEVWRTVLSPAEVAIVERVAGPMMSAFGYVADNPQASLRALMVQGVRFPLHLLGAALANPRRFLIQLKAFSGLRGRAPHQPSVFS